jgi:hypothetical protein
MHMIPLAIHLDKFSMELTADLVEQRSQPPVRIKVEDLLPVLRDEDQVRVQLKHIVLSAG